MLGVYCASAWLSSWTLTRQQSALGGCEFRRTARRRYLVASHVQWFCEVPGIVPFIFLDNIFFVVKMTPTTLNFILVLVFPLFFPRLRIILVRHGRVASFTLLERPLPLLLCYTEPTETKSWHPSTCRLPKLLRLRISIQKGSPACSSSSAEDSPLLFGR